MGLLANGAASSVLFKHRIVGDQRMIPKRCQYGQAGLIDVIVTPPSAALLLQWYTKVKYMNQLPVSYTLGILALEWLTGRWDHHPRETGRARCGLGTQWNHRCQSGGDVTGRLFHFVFSKSVISITVVHIRNIRYGYCQQAGE